MTNDENPTCILTRVFAKLPHGTWFSLHQPNSEFTLISYLFGLSTEEWDSLLLACGVLKIRGTKKRLFMDTFHDITRATDLHTTRRKIDSKDVTLICYGYPTYTYAKAQVKLDENNHRSRCLHLSGNG